MENIANGADAQGAKGKKAHTTNGLMDEALEIPAPNWSRVEAFLAHLGRQKFNFSLFHDKERGRPARTLYGEPSDPAIRSEIESGQNAGYGVFYSVQKMRGPKRGNNEVERIGAAFCEADTPDDRNFPLEPSTTVQSSPGKFHYQWLVHPDEELAPDQFAGIMACMVAEYGSDPKAADLARVLRVPGTYHQKDDPHLVKFTRWSKDDKGRVQTYSVDELVKAFPRPAGSKHVVARTASPTATRFSAESLLRRRGKDPVTASTEAYDRAQRSADALNRRRERDGAADLNSLVETHAPDPLSLAKALACLDDADRKKDWFSSLYVGAKSGEFYSSFPAGCVTSWSSFGDPTVVAKEIMRAHSADHPKFSDAEFEYQYDSALRGTYSYTFGGLEHQVETQQETARSNPALICKRFWRRVLFLRNLRDNPITAVVFGAMRKEHKASVARWHEHLAGCHAAHGAGKTSSDKPDVEGDDAAAEASEIWTSEAAKTIREFALGSEAELAEIMSQMPIATHLRWDPKGSAWYAYDNGIWRRGDVTWQRKMRRQAKTFIERDNTELRTWVTKKAEADKNFDQKKFEKTLLGRLAGADGHRRFQDALGILKTYPKMVLDEEKLNARTQCLVLKDCVLEFERDNNVEAVTCKGMPHSPDYWATGRTDVTFRELGVAEQFTVRAATAASLTGDPFASMEKVGAHSLARVMRTLSGGSPRVVRHILGTVGKSVIGFETRQTALGFDNATRAGKTTYSNHCKDLVGSDLYYAPGNNLLYSPVADGTALLGLNKKRIIAFPELDSEKRINAATFKSLTGGDELEARRTYGTAMQVYAARGLLIGSANRFPRFFGEHTEAVYRRLQLITIQNGQTAANEDPLLHEKLKAELAASLKTHIIYGMLHAAHIGRVPVPDEIQQATAKLRRASDHVQDFLDKRCVLESDGRVPVAIFRQAFIAHVEGNDGEDGDKYTAQRIATQWTPQRLNEALEAKGIAKRNAHRRRHENWVDKYPDAYWDVRLKTPLETARDNGRGAAELAAQSRLEVLTQITRTTQGAVNATSKALDEAAGAERKKASHSLTRAKALHQRAAQAIAAHNAAASGRSGKTAAEALAAAEAAVAKLDEEASNNG